MPEASYYIQMDEAKVRCTLCPHSCTLEDNEHGICGVRRNTRGVLEALSYGRVSGIAIDPVEKKPLYHFLPASEVLSFGSIGCNMSCSFCQNAHISQAGGAQLEALGEYKPGEIIDQARSRKDLNIAYTYNEPIVSFEFVRDTAQQARQMGIRNILVSNGYINPEPLAILTDLMDACNIDLKAFSKGFYKRIAGASLEPVLRTIRQIVKAEIHLEITCLLVPGLNDKKEEFKEMVQWLLDNCGEGLVLHVSRYFPNHKLHMEPTSLKSIEMMMEIAREKLNYVYPGNTSLAFDASTYCPNCDELLIERSYYSTVLKGMDADRCSTCRCSIPGVFNK